MGVELGILSLIGGIAAQTMQEENSRDNANLQKNNQLDLMKEQSKLNQTEWDNQFATTAAYNSPENQIKLKEQAGLNPLYDNGFVDMSPNIGGQTSLGQASSAFTPDFSSAFNSAIQNIFKFRELENETAKTGSEVKRNESEAKKNDAYVVNTGKMTDSEISLNAAKASALTSEKDLNDEQKLYLKESRAAIQSNIEQRWAEIKLAEQQLKEAIERRHLDEFTSRWQKSVAERNASTNEMEARTHEGFLSLSGDQYMTQRLQNDKEYNLKVAQFGHMLQMDDYKIFGDLLDKCTNKWNIGVRSGSDIEYGNFRRLVEMTNAFLDNQSKLSNQAYFYLAPKVSSAQSLIQKTATSVSLNQKVDSKVYNPYPYMPDSNNYLSPQR